MIIAGPDWSLVARMRSDGVIASVDRAGRFLLGRRLLDLIELAQRKQWEVHFNEHEKGQLRAMNLPPVDVVRP